MVTEGSTRQDCEEAITRLADGWHHVSPKRHDTIAEYVDMLLDRWLELGA